MGALTGVADFISNSAITKLSEQVPIVTNIADGACERIKSGG